jgi:hypothetical protein
MAKLSVVVPSNEVEVDGVKYHKVERKAQAGDIVKITDEGAPEYVIVGAFYEVDHVDSYDDPQIIDEDGDEYDLGGMGFEVYEKVTEPAPQPERLKVGDYVKVTDASGSSRAKKGDIAVITGNWSAKIIDVKTLDGRAYGMYTHRFVRATEPEVEAAKKAAERAKKIGEFADGGYAEIVNANYDNASSSARENNGLYVKVEAKMSPWGTRQLTLTLPDGKCGGYCNADALRKVTREEYEEATKPKPVFNVGDSVKLTLPNGAKPRYGFGKISNGDIGKVRHVYDQKIVLDFPAQKNWNALPSELTVVSAEEAKWAAIGRKVGEFKRGDVVSFVKGSGKKTGVGTVEDSEGVGAAIGVRLSGAVYEGTYEGVFFDNGDTAKLLVPVEQRFDRAEGGASTSK